MTLHHAEITRHAWLRFLKRWQGEPPQCYRSELERLISSATEESLGSGTAIRIITNGFKPARYFRCENWRFVTDEDVTSILTIERAYLKKRNPLKKIADKKRYGGKQ